MVRKVWVYILGTLMTLALLGGAFYFGYWSRTPIYSLSLAKGAIETHDVEEFERLIDLHTLLSYAYDDMAESALNRSVGKVPILGALGKDVLKKVTDGAKDIVIGVAQGRVLEYVRTGSAPDGEDKGFYINFALLDSLVLGASVVEYTNIEDNMAIVGVRLYPKGIKDGFVFQLEMQKFKHRWRLVRIKNLKEFCDTL